MRLRTILVVVMLAFGTRSFAEAETVGVRDLAVAAADRAAAIQAKLWYPAGNGGDAVLVGDNAVFRGTPAASNAPIAAGRFPLILLSHGGFRAAPDTASWLASALAAKGYVVAVVRPPAIPPGPPAQSVLSELWLRPADISATLTAVEKELSLAAAIDPGRIGAVGFFLGGYAVLELAGVRVDPAAYARSCDRNAVGLDCAWFAHGAVDLHRVDADRLARSNLDPRLKSVVVVDPELTGVLTPQSLAAVSLPVQGINLGRPNAIPAAMDASKLASAIRGGRYDTIADAASYSSFAECKPKGPAILREEGGEVQLCEDGGGRSRAEIHEQLAAMIDAALRRSLSTNP